MVMTMIETSGIRVLKWLVCIPLMIMIGIIQAAGIILTAISAVVFKTISVLMIFVTLLLRIFGLFTWMQTAVVFLIGMSMFWLSEGIALVMYALAFVQAKLLDLMNT